MRSRAATHFALVGAFALIPFACADREARDASSARDPIVVAIASSVVAPSAVDAGVAAVDAAPDAADDDAPRGDMFGDSIGDSFGAGGLGLSGVGEGAGQSEGIGLGSVGGAGRDGGRGNGVARGASDAGRRPAAPRMREGAVTVNGRLPPEVVRRIVRQNFGRFRLCYEGGLRKNPKLAGTVTTRFTIDTSGAVANPADAGSTLADKTVVACVVRGFGALSFPQPEGGTVVVSYPIELAPGE